MLLSSNPAVVKLLHAGLHVLEEGHSLICRMLRLSEARPLKLAVIPCTHTLAASLPLSAMADSSLFTNNLHSLKLTQPLVLAVMPPHGCS